MRFKRRLYLKQIKPDETKTKFAQILFVNRSNCICICFTRLKHIFLFDFNSLLFQPSFSKKKRSIYLLVI